MDFLRQVQQIQIDFVDIYYYLFSHDSKYEERQRQETRDF